jgi:hypothetical protein
VLEIIPHSFFFWKENLIVYNKLKIYKIPDNILYVQSLHYSFIYILLIHQPSYFPKWIIILHTKRCGVKDNAQLRDKHLEIISQLHVTKCKNLLQKQDTVGRTYEISFLSNVSTWTEELQFHIYATYRPIFWQNFSFKSLKVDIYTKIPMITRFVHLSNQRTLYTECAGTLIIYHHTKWIINYYCYKMIR